jgi:hypothetical protein
MKSAGEVSPTSLALTGPGTARALGLRAGRQQAAQGDEPSETINGKCG